MSNNIIIGNKGNGSLGDCLWISSIFRHRHGKVILHNDLQSKQVSTIFNDIAEVEFSDNPPERLDHNCKLPIHRGEKILRSYNIDSSFCLPFVKITKDEIDWAKEFLKDYKNLIVINNDNSGSKDPNNIRANYVRPPVELMEEQCKFLINIGYTPIQFAKKELFTPLNNCIQLINLNIRQTLACFSIIKRYIGGDTGLYHLMLAAGGSCDVFIPDESIRLGYIYSDLLYSPKHFGNNPFKLNYFNYNTLKKFNTDI